MSYANNPTSSENWDLSAHDLATFVTSAGRVPRQTDAETAVERRLGRWLGNQRRALKGYDEKGEAWTPERKARLDALIPGWEHRNTRPSTRPRSSVAWLTRAESLVAFIEENGHFPRSDNGDADERRLGKWLVNQRQGLKGRGTTAWDDNRKAYLDIYAPGWALSPSIRKHCA